MWACIMLITLRNIKWRLIENNISYHHHHHHHVVRLAIRDARRCCLQAFTLVLLYPLLISSLLLLLSSSTVPSCTVVSIPSHLIICPLQSPFLFIIVSKNVLVSMFRFRIFSLLSLFFILLYVYISIASILLLSLPHS